ncbi:unnamed protein product [Mytilus edulis]|uniref:Uncharacterized protein n=1 Tax=Mytilus edulis TaxID=6550 RepID=A0A8S3VQJ1_MYTED|nr:unnamed protein product [Mytilus edulis]
MAKRKAEALNDDEISGYLVEVSPIKTSQQNNKYFDGTINSNRKTFQHFDVSKHSQFRSAGTQKSPVKLQRISQVPNFSCKEQPKETSEQCTLEKMQNLPEKSKVNVVATVMNKSNTEIVDEESTSTTITGAITQIILNKSAQCGNCHKSIKDIPTGNLVRCNSCNMKQLKSNLNNAYLNNVKDLSTSQVIKLNMFSSILLTFLTENLKLSLLSEMEDVEDYLLEQQHLTITYNSGNKVVLNFRKQDDFASHILLDVCVLSLGYVYVT